MKSPSRLLYLSGLLFVPAFLSAAPFPTDYSGTPFNDATYRAEQLAEAEIPRQPYLAFAPALVAWNSKTPTGSGWVGPEEPGASIQLDAPDRDGRQTIHYHVALNNYRYAVFGWQFEAPDRKPVDLRSYDAVSFSIKITGPKKPQEMFFGTTAAQPAPLSLRAYDPSFADGSWHRITIPIRAMKWTGPLSTHAEVRGFTFKTFVWDPSEYDVQLDHFTFDRATKTAAAIPLKSTAVTAHEPGQTIPGKIEAAFYDLGGEGIAYHDTTPINILSAVLNQQSGHQRPHATRYEWNFRSDEGVDLSFTKDWADLNHPNLSDIPANQLYIGGTEDGEWCNYTVEVKKAGTYKIIAAYGNDANGQNFTFSLNGQPASECHAPVVTGSMHKWNQADVGRITFPEAGKQLLTLHYGRGFNLGYFEFVALP